METSQIIQSLKNTRELLSNEDHWCQGWYAKKVDGTYTDAYSADACCWCLLGGIKRILGRNSDLTEAITCQVEKTLQDERLFRTDDLDRHIVDFNDYDTTGHADILMVIDKTINRLTKGDNNGNQSNDQMS